MKQPVSSILAVLLCSTQGLCNSIGVKPEVSTLLDTTESTLVSPALNIAAVSGQRLEIADLPNASSSGSKLSYFWSCESGLLASDTADFNRVFFTPELTSSATNVPIYFCISSASGHTMEGMLTASVSPVSLVSAVPTGQLTASYNPATNRFSVSYDLRASVTRAWVLASLNGTEYSTVLSIDPVTTANRSGVTMVTVAGSATASRAYFRLRTQTSAGVVDESVITTVAYTPTPAIPKSTELPNAPNLVINGLEVSVPQAQLFWGRVNDRLNQDNVVKYEVERATNADFSGAVLLDAGNTAPGMNMYESVFYTAVGLSDNTAYYFRVRGVNNVGTGPWSNVDSIRVNVQDRPVIEASPVFPAHGALGVTKLPALECLVSDPEGDAFYCAFEIAESPTGPWRYFGHGGQQDYRNVTRLDPVEWNSPLKPNTHYYWRAIVHEEGRNLDYYGGAWPTSLVWEFTTENVGPAFGISSVTHLSGMLKIGEILTYRVTVVNNGNEDSDATLVQAFYVKSGVENRFAYAGWGSVPALAPGASTETDVSVMFRSDLLTTADGTVLDNILVTGTSTLRFKTFPEPTALSTATYNYTLNYVNAGGPTIYLQPRGTSTNNPYAPIGGTFNIVVDANDDIRTSRVLLEYRTNPAAPWVTLDDYTGNTGPRMIFPDATHSGPTDPWGQNAVGWTFPSSWGPTSTLQVRATAYDDVGAYTVAVSGPMTIYDNTFAVSAKTVQFPAYRLGESVSVPVSLSRGAGANVTNIQVFYYASPIGPYSILLNQTSATQYESLTLPPVLTVTLPTADAYASNNAFLRVIVRGVIPGIASLNSTDDSDGTFTTDLRDLPAPFHTAVKLFNGTFTDWPAGAWGKSEWDEATVLDWEGDTRVHALVQQQYSYLLTDTNGSTNSYQGNIFHHTVYDRTTGIVTTVPLPAGYNADDLKVHGGTPYVLLRSGTGLYWSWKSGSSFVTPQFLLNLVSLYTTTPEFVTRSGELLVAYSTRNDTSGGGTPATWRNRLLRVQPTLGSVLEQSSYLGAHLDYGSNYLNGDSGLYAINSGGSITSTLKTWTGNLLWFSSANSSIVGASQVYENDRQVLDFYSPTAVATRWNVDVQDIRARVFSDVALAVGQGTTSSPAGEDGYKVVIRRNLATGVEERIRFGSWGQGFSPTGRHSAVSDGRWVAVNWNRLLAVGNLAADLVAPTVTHATSDSTFTNGVSKSFSWTLSDNLGQLASLKVIKIAGGISTTLANYTNSPLPTSATFTLNESASSAIIRLEAYDTDGNRGVAETVFTQNRTFTLDSFTSASYSLPTGSTANLSWTSTPEDDFRTYTLLLRPVGSTSWTTITSVTGNTFPLDTSLLSGGYEMQIESSGVTRTLAQTLTITGERFAFDAAAFSPASGIAHYLSSTPSLHLSWGSNQPETTATSYTVLGRWNGVGNYVVLGSTTDKQLDVTVPGGATQIEWKISALWQGLGFVSTTKTVSLASVGAAPAPEANAGGRDTSVPWVDLTWPSILGSESYAVFRRHIRTGVVAEVARTESPSYHDDSVSFGEGYAYSIALVLSGMVDGAGAETTITVEPLLPLGITFVNSQYEILAANTNVVQWNAVLPSGVVSVFQDYEVILRGGDGTIANVYSVQPAPGAPSQVNLAALAYNRSFVLEVFARSPSGTRLSVEPARLHFSTGFDTRTIAGAAAVGVPDADAYGFNLSWEGVVNADYYDIFRRTTSTGPLEWIGRSSTTGFSDTGIQPGQGASYVVRSRNGLMYTDAVETTPRPFGEQQNLRPTGAMRLLGGQDFEFGFTSQYGATYRVEYSPDLMNWLHFGSSISGSGEDMNILVPGIGTSGRYFFRVVKP